MSKTKLPKRLKALLALHGVCAAFLLLYAVLLLAISILTNGVPFPVLAWWIPNAHGFIDVLYYAAHAQSYSAACCGSLVELFGFALAVSNLIFMRSLPRRRKASIPALCVIAASELGAIFSWAYSFWENRDYMTMSIWFAFWSIAVMLPFVSALVLTFISRNPIKAHLEAAK